MTADKSKRFVAELKRRNVFRVAIAYLAVAWLVIQVAETILPAYGLGDVAVRTVVTFFAVMFIPVVVLAWFFELTPDGIVAEADADHTSAQALSRGRKFDFAIIGVLSVALLFFISMHDWQGDEITQTTGPPDKSVAVLPFVNLSELSENEYFSDGLTETLLHALAQVPDIKVPARTSSFFFKGQDIDIRDIANELDVSNVLEGSVQRQGNTVRITAQLIEAETGYHLWSQNYDREMGDIFAVQDEIASAVAQALQVTLLGAGGKVIQVSGTDSVPAYEAYLKGVEQLKTTSILAARSAADYFNEALAHDPEFISARIKLGQTYFRQAALGELTAQELIPLIGDLVEEVLAVEPENHQARFLQLQTERIDATNIDRAIDLIEKITSESPDEVEYYYTAYFLLQRANRGSEGVQWLERGLEVDPLSSRLLYAHGSHMQSVGRLDEAEVSFLRSIELNPDDPTAYGYASSLYWEQKEFVQWYSVLRQAMDAEGVDAEVPVHIGLHLMTFGMDEEADAYLGRAKNVSAAHPYLLAAELYREVVSGNHERALANSERLLREKLVNRRGSRTFVAIIYIWLMQEAGKLDEVVAFLENEYPGISSPGYETASGFGIGVRFHIHAARVMSGSSQGSVDALAAAADEINSRFSNWEGLPGVNALVAYLADDIDGAVELALEDLDGRRSLLQTWDWPLRYRHFPPYAKLAEQPAIATRLAEIETEARVAGEQIRAYIEQNDLQL